MNNVLKYSVVFALFLLLILVRAFENYLFYDPLIGYFQNDYLYKQAPELNSWKLVLNLLYRYLINTIISLVIIYAVYRNFTYVKLSAKIYVVAFCVLILAFGFLLNTSFENGYLLPFYLRRFLIHPLLLLVFLPAFYYHQMSR